MRQQARPASLLTGAMSVKGERSLQAPNSFICGQEEREALRQVYEAAGGDRVVLLRVLRPSDAATEDCTCGLSRRGERILELLKQCR